MKEGKKGFTGFEFNARTGYSRKTATNHKCKASQIKDLYTD